MRQYAADDLPDHVSSTSDEMVTQVLAVQNVSAAQLVPVLRPLMPQNAQLSAVTGANILILSDHASNVNRMMRIIARIDQTGSSDIDVIPLQSATAADTARVLTTLLAQTGEAAHRRQDRRRRSLQQHSRQWRCRAAPQDQDPGHAPGHPGRHRHDHAGALPALLGCRGSRRPTQGAALGQRRSGSLDHEQAARRISQLPATTQCARQHAQPDGATPACRRRHRRRRHALAGGRHRHDLGRQGHQFTGHHGRPAHAARASTP